MGNGSIFELAVELQDNLNEAQARIQGTKDAVSDLKAEIANVNMSPMSEALEKAFRAGGPAAATRALKEMTGELGGAGQATANASRSMLFLQQALQGNVRAMAMVGGTAGAVIATLLSFYEIGKKIGGMLSDLADRMEDTFSLSKGYYKDWANTIQYESGRAVKAFQDVADASDDMIARQQRERAVMDADQSREKRLQSVRGQYAVAFGDATSEDALDTERRLAIKHAKDNVAKANRDLSELRGQLPSARQEMLNAKDVAKNAQEGAESMGQDPAVMEAYKKAKDNAEMVTKRYKELQDKIGRASEQAAKAYKDAQADVEDINSQAAIRVKEIRETAKKAADEQRTKEAEFQGKAKSDEAAAMEKARDYMRSKESPEKQLEYIRTEMARNRAEMAGASGPVDPGTRAKLIERQLELARRQDELTRSSSDKTSERGSAIASASERIREAGRLRVGGAGIGDVFTRLNDMRHGRSATDQAALETAESCRVIAENTKLLKEMGVVK
jgi:hypothetical protein